MGLLPCMITLFLVVWVFFFFFLGTSILFSKVAAQIYIPSSSVGGFLFLQNSLFVDFLLMAVLTGAR